ncbi:hypothetical protein AMTRI_Chr01g131190 [Amborella trichopoda]
MKGKTRDTNRPSKERGKMAGCGSHMSWGVTSCFLRAGKEPPNPKPNNRMMKKDSSSDYRVLILGGTGRVGGSTATALAKKCPNFRILIGGRNSLLNILAEHAATSNSLNADVDLVVHAAGPFQREEKCSVLEVAISTKTPYVDVCDDRTYALCAKSFHEKAVAAEVPAITTAGIYPGVSSVMAAELVREAKIESSSVPERLRFYYYTAGSGGAGPTILATSFLLLGEDVIAYNKGEKVKLKPYSGMLNIDFGKGIGKRDVFLLNLPEVGSAYEVLNVPTVSARFGTAPFFWNWGMSAIATLVPKEILRERSKVQQLVRVFDPIVRVFDGIAGERMSMRVDLECANGRNTLGIYSHKKLLECVGIATSAFVMAVLEGSTHPGVWFPEEPQGIAIDARKLLLERASEGTINFIMNKPPWMVETNPKELGLGIYV